jgi:hypothetical protein
MEQLLRIYVFLVFLSNKKKSHMREIPGWLNELGNNSYKPITNTAWVCTRLCKLQKGYTRLAAASDKVYQLLVHGQWFSPGTSASSTTKTGSHDIAKSGTQHNKSNQITYVREKKILLCFSELSILTSWQWKLFNISRRDTNSPIVDFSMNSSKDLSISFSVTGEESAFIS